MFRLTARVVSMEFESGPLGSLGESEDLELEMQLIRDK